MLNDRADECRATLDPERMAVEVIFRLQGEHGEWLYWFELAGEHETGLTAERAIDRDHIGYATRVKEPGHVAAIPEVLLFPAPVEQVIRAWAAHGRRVMP